MNMKPTYNQLVQALRETAECLAAWMEIADPSDVRTYDEKTLNEANALIKWVDVADKENERSSTTQSINRRWVTLPDGREAIEVKRTIEPINGFETQHNYEYVQPQTREKIDVSMFPRDYWCRVKGVT